MQRIGSAIGIAIIGTVLFGTLHFDPPGPNVALAFSHSATLAMTVSAVLSIAAFALVFALPRRNTPSIGASVGDGRSVRAE
jgi:membrane protease YdiL (CAAX protease family)